MRNRQSTVGVCTGRRNAGVVRCVVVALLVTFAFFASDRASHARGVYVTNSASNTVSEYSMLPNGELVSLSGAGSVTTVLTDDNPQDVAVGPPGPNQAAYVANVDGNRSVSGSPGSISQYSVNSDGSLAEMFNPSVPAGHTTTGVAVTPSGDNVYATNSLDGTVSQYSVNSDGSLTPLSPSTVSAGGEPTDIAILPNGKNAYVTNETDGTVSQYSIGSKGQLTALSGGAVAAPPGADSITVLPSGKAVYVASFDASVVTGFTVGSGGQLTVFPTNPVATDISPNGIAMSPLGTSLYVMANGTAAGLAAGSGTIDEFAVQSNLLLVRLASSPVASGANPQGAALSPAGTSMYVPTYGAGAPIINQYSVASDGTASPLTAPFAIAESNPFGVAVQPAEGPTASFSATPVPGSDPEVFTASAATSDDPAVMSYTWDFGDGTARVTTTSAQTTHEYASSGIYTVTVIAASDGCSTQPLVFTGQTISCDGSQLADFSQNVQVVVSPPSPNNPSGGGTNIVPAGGSGGGGNNGGGNNGGGGKSPVALGLTLSGKKQQRLTKRGVTLQARCNNSDCTVKLGGSASVAKASEATSVASKVAFKRVTTHLEMGSPKTIRLKFANKKAFGVLRGDLAKKLKTEVKITGTATDTVSQTATSSLELTLVK